MNKKMRGVVRGKTIELTEDPGMPDGQDVQIELETVQPASDGEKRGWFRIAGIAADDPDWDRIMEEIYLERKGIYRTKADGQ